MSNYTTETKHPRTGKWEMADWIDDMFGNHRYGVRFPSDGLIFRPDFEELETREPVTRSTTDSNNHKETTGDLAALTSDIT